MKKLAFWSVISIAFLASSTIFADKPRVWEGKFPIPENYVSQENQQNFDFASIENGVNIRSGDPCKIIENKWASTMVMDELKHGNAEHNLDPSKAFVLSAEENDGNVCALLTHMAVAQGIKMKLFGWDKDGEYKLLTVMNYGSSQSDRYRWYGAVPQWVGTSYQYALGLLRKLTFQEAFRQFTDGQASWSNYEETYVFIAWFLNYHLGTNYSLRPTSNGYYKQFRSNSKNRATMIEAVQAFFEAMEWPFQDKDFFWREGSPSIVNYDAPTFCK